MREVVDFPTATEPATPMMKGDLASSALRKRVDTVYGLRRLDIEREAAQRQVDLLGLVERDRVVERRRRLMSSALSVIGSSARSATTPPW